MSLIASLTFNMIIYSPPASAGIFSLDDNTYLGNFGVCDKAKGDEDCKKYEELGKPFAPPCGPIVFSYLGIDYGRCANKPYIPPLNLSTPTEGPSPATISEPLMPPPLPPVLTRVSPPTITMITPNSAPKGSSTPFTVTITGTGFDPVESTVDLHYSETTAGEDRLVQVNLTPDRDLSSETQLVVSFGDRELEIARIISVFVNHPNALPSDSGVFHVTN